MVHMTHKTGETANTSVDPRQIFMRAYLRARFE